MNFLIILRVSLRSLRRTLMRSLLTTLGIIIGVAAVIIVVAIGNGAKAKMKDNMIAMIGPGILTIDARPPMRISRMSGPVGFMGLPPGDGLSLGDYAEIRRRFPDIVAGTPVLRGGSGQMRGNGLTANVEISGLDVDGLECEQRQLVRGSFFGEIDVSSAANVCVLSQHVANALFPGTDPVGRRVRFKNLPFVVIGVMSPRQLPMPMPFEDAAVYIPYTSVLRRLDRRAFVSLRFIAAGPEALPSLAQRVSEVLEARRGDRKAEFANNDFTQVAEALGKDRDTMTLLLASIAGISLLVGGIGVMNIMLVSVTERTREIGIRLALGTRGRDVLRQFVFEAVILSVLGGSLGIAVGVGGAKLITALGTWRADVTVLSILGSFLISAAIGVFFGWYPARRASKLDPIEALRYE